MVNYYTVVFLLRPPYLLRRGPFLERKNVCNSQENGVRTRCSAIVNHGAIVNSLRVVHVLRVALIPLSMLFSQEKCGLAEKSAVSLLFLPFSALFWPKKGSVPLFGNFLPTLFSSKLRFFEPPNALGTTKKARVETTPKKHRKRKKHRPRGIREYF